MKITPDKLQSASISQAGLELIKKFEGLHKLRKDGMVVPYLDPVGILTIGYGHTNHQGRKFDKFTVWTKQEAEEALREDLKIHEDIVKSLVKVPITQGQFDALVSFCFNLGGGNLSRSTLLRKLNAGDYLGAANEFPRWNRAGGKILPGLVKRREAEKNLFLSDIDEADFGNPGFSSSVLGAG